MNIENTQDIKDNIERIPLKERMEFQRTLMKLILGKKSSYKDSKEWHKVTIRWIEKYRNIISNIIDNTENKEIRDLIMKKEYEEASIIITKMLEENN